MKSPKPTRCKKCGSIRWLQKELRKTGMVVVDGTIIFSEMADDDHKTYLSCYDCGSSMPDDQQEEVMPNSSFPEPIVAEAN